MGQLVFQATLGGQVNLVGPNTASTLNINVPAFAGTMASLASVTANGVNYVNSSGQPTSGSGFVFDGTNVGIGTSSIVNKLTVNGNQTLFGTNPYLTFSSVYNTTPAYFQFYTSTGEFQMFNSGTGSNGYLTFLTGAGTERMRIDSSGNLLVGTTSKTNAANGVSLSPTESFFTATDTYVALFNRRGTDGSVLLFQNDQSNVGSISVSGTATAYNTSSDYRLKHDVQPMTGALAKVAALKPVTYKWNADDSNGEGFIAHELQEVVPDCVTGEKDAVDADGNPVYQGIDTSFLVATLTAAIKELKALVDTQASTITALQADVAALKGTA